MAPISHSRPARLARRSDLSPGAIAGTVVGCVIGGSLLLVVLGFLYFRYRRRSIEAKADFSQAGRNTDFPSEQPPAIQRDHSLSIKGDRSTRVVPGFSDANSLQQSTTPAYGDSLTRDHEALYENQALGQPPLPQNIDFSLPAHQPASSVADGPNSAAQPSDHDSAARAAANSSYYDTRISMDSDPAQPPLPPSRQMTQMYEAQLRDSRDHRKRSGSLTSRIWSSIKRKRSTHSSSHGTSGAQQHTSQHFFPTSPVDSPVSFKQEPGLELLQAAEVQPKTSTNRYFEEPGEMSETADEVGSGRDRQQQKRQKRWGGDSQYDDFPLRTDSTRREPTERDPELPSSALQGPGSTNGLPPSAQPQSEISPPERLGTPDIPEPMDIAPTHEDAHGASVFRNSQSPPLAPEAFISPMAIMRPSNTIEQVAYTNYQMDHSPSPPDPPPTPPEIITDQPMQETLAIPSHDPHNDVDNDSYLSIPSDDEPRRSGDSYDYSTTPGQSTTDASMGRTPDTRITISPSPYPTVHEHVKIEPESSSSPEASSRPSPQSPGLLCEECGRQFDQIHKLNHHKRYHERKHECTYEGCDKRFGTKTHLDRHINDKHVKSKSYHCTEPTCSYFKGGKAFPRKDNWRRHMIKKHGATNDLEPMDESIE
ncbi:hypothetical protein F4779DRAFT_527795 [Xylariaceae sp. FL0662B]|nr:hypothetical protein F4779DRAFT_527795 [Xylariaceae sp. FL0662B]